MTKRYDWSKQILTDFIEAQTWEKCLLNQANFDLTIPIEQRVKARLAVKDEYIFDFAKLSTKYSEHELEMQLVNNIRRLFNSNVWRLYVRRKSISSYGGKKRFIY